MVLSIVLVFTQGSIKICLKSCMWHVPQPLPLPLPLSLTPPQPPPTSNQILAQKLFIHRILSISFDSGVLFFMCEGYYNNRKCRISVELQGKPYWSYKTKKWVLYVFVSCQLYSYLHSLFVTLCSKLKSFQENDRENEWYKKAYNL